MQYTKVRNVFGTSLFGMQNTRFELARCATLTRTTQAFVDECLLAYLDGTLDVAAASMAKVHATEVQGEVLDRCLKLFGGYGCMLEYPIACMYADACAQRIYRGANEIMKDLIVRTLMMVCRCGRTRRNRIGPGDCPGCGRSLGQLAISP